MRRPRDIDAELKQLEARAKELKARKTTQLGELVMATAADTMPIEELVGALLALAGTTDAQRREAWRKRGAAFFLGGPKTPGPHRDAGGDAAQPAGDQPAEGPGRAS